MNVTKRNNEFWIDKIRAFLHDPPDKVIKIQNHKKRRNEILGDELKFREDRGVGKLIFISDLMASSLQRIDLEKVYGKMLSPTFYKIHDEKYILVGVPVLRHPITGSIREYNLISSVLPDFSNSSNEKEYKEKFDKILRLFIDAEKEAFNELTISTDFTTSYLTLWRFYPELLKKKVAEKFKERHEFEELRKQLAEEFVNLTAYTLSPDHTLFDHADATSAIYGALIRSENESEENPKPYLLMFKLSPVQDFIKNARKERDLWAGSHLLSFLTFQAIKVVVDAFGPDAVIFPHLRGQPFFDKEYENMFKDVPDDIKPKNLNDKLKIANIPNRFLAIVGFKDQKEIENLKNEIKSTIKNTIRKIFNYAWDKTITNDILERVRNELTELKEKAESKDKEGYEKALKELDKLSKDYYQRLAENYFRITLEVLESPFELDESGKIKEESYEILENFVKGLKLPKNVEKKYLDWLNILKSFGTHPARIFDLYSLMFEVLEEIVGIESRKFVKVEGQNAYKCSLCGELEAIGGKDYVLMKVLWLEISGLKQSKFKKNEHLCPICLVKRFYHEWLKEMKKWDIKTGFESVSDVALKKGNWLLKVESSKLYKELIDSLKTNETLGKLVKNVDEYKELIDCELLYIENWNPKYLEDNFNIDVSEAELEEPKKIIEKIYDEHGKPEKYYSILIMDGDNMGKMLVGDEMKPVKNYLHPKILKYLPQDAKENIEKTKRLITPATHSAISRALAYFSVNKVPKIVENHRGELIYAGGDDVLALLPVDTALRCAYDIQNEFNKDWDGWELLPAKTMSVGMLIVHYKHPLYDALDKARMLEKKAKELGRNAVTMGYLARSGNYDEAVFNWDAVPKLDYLVWLIKNSKENEKPNLSRRIIYHVVEEIDKVSNDEGAITSFLKYELLRHYDGSNKEEVVGNLLEKIMAIAKKIRVEVGLSDIGTKKYGLIDEKALEEKLNVAIQKLIKNGDSSPEKLYDVVGVKIDDCKFYEELYGLILKKQVKSLFILLKILINCDAKLGGGRCENTD